MDEILTLPNGGWSYDPQKPLGQPGGFGEVFEGHSDAGDLVAVKRLRAGLDVAAHREFFIAQKLLGRTYEHVIPILDFGENDATGEAFIIMARADCSLKEKLKNEGPLADLDATDLLLQVARGLSEIRHIVHRDLKPANVLLHGGRWKVADFGIARLADKTTSEQTLRGCMSAPYAAPEQWRGQRATNATDVYALACVGYALLTGKPPFLGPDFEQQHLKEAPPSLQDHGPRLRSLLSAMLRKEDVSRPGLCRVVSRLESLLSAERPFSPGLQALAQADADYAERSAVEELRTHAELASNQDRHSLARQAMKLLEQLIEQFIAGLVRHAPSASEVDGFESQTVKGQVLANLRLGDGDLVIRRMPNLGVIPRDAFPLTEWDVITGATIEVQQLRPKYCWGASLWFTNLHSRPEYRWYDVAYCTHALSRRRAESEPFALTDPTEADKAASIAMHVIELAYNPKPVDDEDVDDAINRYGGLLAQASKGQLGRPNLPIEHMTPMTKRRW